MKLHTRGIKVFFADIDALKDKMLEEQKKIMEELKNKFPFNKL